MCKYWRLKHERVWAEFWSVHHVIRVVRPAGVSLQEVWIRRKSSLQAQVPARLQPFPYRFFPPLSLLKTHPASLNVTSHHHIVTPDRTLFAWIQDGFFPPTVPTCLLEMQTQVWAGHEDALITESVPLTSRPPPDLSHRGRLYLGMSCLRGKVTQNSYSSRLHLSCHDVR